MLNTAPIAPTAPSSCLVPATACGNAPASDETHPFSQALGRAEARQRAASGNAPDAADGANADAADPDREAPGVRPTDAPGTRGMPGARRGAAPSTALRDALADLHASTPAHTDTEPMPGTGVPSIDSEPDALESAAAVLGELAALMSGLPVPRTAAADGPATPLQTAQQAMQRSERPGRSALAHEHAPGQRAAATRDTAQGSEHAASAFAQGTQALSMATLMQSAGVIPHPKPAPGAITLPVDPAAAAQGIAPGQRAVAVRDTAQGSEHAASAFAQGTQALRMATFMQSAGVSPHPKPAPGAITLPVDPAAAAQGIRAITEAAWQGTAATTVAERAQGSVDIFVTGAPLLASALPAAMPRSDVAALPFQAELTAAMGSSEFAPALGARLSMLVHDGIEHAQLKLNPAEMGPIEVRIRLDGSQAQVDFSAAQASTRQALQDAVPALASALRESGLTLTGGGVFDQPREPRGEPRAQDTRAGFTSGEAVHEGTVPGTGVPRMPRARGVVDLYA